MNAPGSSQFTASIFKDIFLTIITCGIYNIFIQYRQIQALNAMLNRPKYDFLKWLLLSIVTCFIYHLYHEYVMAQDVVRCNNEPQSSEPIICLVISLMGFPIIADAIMQRGINRYYGHDEV